MTWKEYEEVQKQICKENGADWQATPPDFIIGLATNLDKTPIYGVRDVRRDKTSGWYIWSGEYSAADDFYKPVCAAHLVDLFPPIVHYLGLAEGWRFIIDKDGYEDIWYEQN